MNQTGQKSDAATAESVEITSGVIEAEVMGQASAVDDPSSILDKVPDGVLRRAAHDLSLGLDCNVSTLAFKESVAVLFSEMEAAGWVFSPPFVPPVSGERLGNRGCRENMPLVSQEN